MKNCQACGRENADDMSFCLDCGTPLAAAHPPGWLGGEATTSLGETPTTVRGGIFETQPFPKDTAYNVAASPSKPGKKLFMIIGGVASLFLLLFAVGAAIVGYNYYARSNGITTSLPTPTNGNNGNKPATNSSPAPSFTPPTVATKSGNFTVYANGGWQLSNIDTVELENFKTRIDGKVDIAGVKTSVTSSGVDDAGSKSRRIYPEFPTGALVMRTHYADGKFSNVMAVTANKASGSWRNFKDEAGRIEFCINDNSPGQNGGQFTVFVTMTNVPKAKK